MEKITSQVEVEIGDRVSYQCAGMDTPEHGVVSSFPQMKNGLFVRFGNDLNGKFVELDFLRKGHCTSWYRQVPHPTVAGRMSWQCVG